MAEALRKGAYYEHYKGGIYVVVGDATRKCDLSREVVYRDSSGNLWIRPIGNFLETFPDGSRRFRPVLCGYCGGHIISGFACPNRRDRAICQRHSPAQVAILNFARDTMAKHEAASPHRKKKCVRCGGPIPANGGCEATNEKYGCRAED